MDKAHKRMRGDKPCRWMGTVSRKKSSCLQELMRNPVYQCFTSCNIPMNDPGGLALYSFWSNSLCGVWEFAYQTNDVDTLIWILHLPFNQKCCVSCLHLNDYHCVAARMRNYSDPDSKLSLQFMSESVFPMFSSRSFIVCGLTFRSLIHFEFIFVHGVRKCSSFILLQVVDQFSQHHLLKKLSFFHCISLPPLLKIRWP